jgi:tRNA(Glu) U13 pseudouridine synthase TruD
MAYEYWTKSPGTGGTLRSNSDFIVREIISQKFTKKYSRGEKGIETVKGPYVLFLLEKNGLNTQDALKIIAKELRIRVADIGYAGLKDKNAITYQYVTIKGIEKEILTDSLKLTKVGYSKNMMSIGDLVANKFEITLHDCKKPENIEAIINEIKKNGLPNYFGPQRFGINNNNQEIGKLLLTRKFDKVVKMIGCGDNIEKVTKTRLKFFIHAYQSWIFNEALMYYVKNKKKIDKLPIIGFGTNKNMILKNIMKKEGVSADDFRINELMLTCTGGVRDAFIKVSDITYNIHGKDLKLSFALPKGSYATVLLKELTKNDK